MYRGFNIENISFEDEIDLVHQYENTVPNIDINEDLMNFLDDDFVFDGSAIQEDWFPQINADIFISHSHRDEKTAKALAMWLKNEFNLTAFIDSTVWGYFEELLSIIQLTTDLASTTSHVHMMLNMALMQMIDKTECLFFLNTPNSIILNDEIEAGTYSPWIYSELGISQIIQKKIPARYTNIFLLQSTENKRLYEDSKFRYKLNVSHLLNLDCDKLNKWKNKFTEYSQNDSFEKIYREGMGFPDENQLEEKHPLDILYELNPINHSLRG